MLLHKFFIQDGKLLPVMQFEENTGIEIYEVVRVINGVPLFLEDHLSRFRHSAWMLHLEIPLTDVEIREWIERLVGANEISEGNIRFSYCFRPCGRFQACFIPHSYPDKEMYENGVACGLLYALREDPNVKAVQRGLRARANALISEGEYYEVLLVNDVGRITEGSRSNLFIVKGGVLYTAPDSEVLPGITRIKVIGLAEEMGVELVYESPSLDDLEHADAVFLTGTSPKVLPVSRIGVKRIHPDHPLVKELIRKYEILLNLEGLNLED